MAAKTNGPRSRQAMAQAYDELAALKKLVTEMRSRLANGPVDHASRP